MRLLFCLQSFTCMPLAKMLGSGSMVRRQTGKRQPPKQCNGVTKQGCRCSITSDCELKDSSGARVSDPLLHGGARCLFHTEIFTYCPCVVTDGLVFFLDFETTGLNVLKHHIVEIAVLSQCNAVFQTVVCLYVTGRLVPTPLAL